MEVVVKPIKSIKPYERNPRKNDPAVNAVAESIREFGWQQPIVIDIKGVIIAGHTRYKAAIKLGMTDVPCVVADGLTPEQVKAYRIADNKTGELSDWNMELLGLELDEITTIDMSAFGFTPEDHFPSVVEDDFDIVLPDEPITKLGDIWKLGEHRLICGDSTKTETLLLLMGGCKVDLLCTDPPYNVDYHGAAGVIANDNMPDDQFRAFLTDALISARTVMRNGAAFYIWHADTQRSNLQAAAAAAGFDIKQCLIWVKSGLVIGRQDYQWKHEPCLYGWIPGATHFWHSDRKQRTTITCIELEELRHKDKGELLKYIEQLYCDNDGADSTIIYEDKPQRNPDHPTMKPVRLLARLVHNSSKHGDIVIDPFAGSGSTAIACEQINRRCYMAELDPKYCDVIVARWEAFANRKAVLSSG